MRSCRSPAGHTKRPCAEENDATVPVIRAAEQASFLKRVRFETWSRYRARNRNVCTKTKVSDHASNKFQYCPRLNIRNGTGMKRKRFDWRLSLKARRRVIK